MLDPFGGSGTTCLAAQESGATSFAVEVHPAVARIAKAKLLWGTDPNDFRAVVSHVLRVVKKKNAVDVPSSPLVAKCFPDSDSLSDLLRIRDAVCADPVPAWQNAESLQRTRGTITAVCYAD